MENKKANSILFVLLVFLSCSLPRLGITKSDVAGNPIKMHGFYYNKPDYWSFIFYQNGIFRGDFGAGDEKSIDYITRTFTDSNNIKNDYRIPYAWGLFKIDGSKISIEKWESREWAAYGITKYSGIILNDSTLLIDHPVVGKDTFYFHYLPVKPDSTNKFIRE
ncbi:MAG: hypothetical protein Q8941_14960 [Bacteroidota bacterium]|nr:hypothetical protein [Bacteroidota bacterium]